MVGAYVAATIVALVQYLRFKDRRLLALVFLFACQAQALSREWFDLWKDVFQTCACASALLLLLIFSPRLPPKPAGRPPDPASPPGDEPVEGPAGESPRAS